MYCAPLGLAYANRPDELLDLSPALSALTHHDERCRTAVLAVTLAVAALVRGQDRRAAAETGLGAVLEHEGGEELEFLVEQVGRSRSIDGPDQGFCLFTAGAVGGYQPESFAWDQIWAYFAAVHHLPLLVDGREDPRGVQAGHPAHLEQIL